MSLEPLDLGAVHPSAVTKESWRGKSKQLERQSVTSDSGVGSTAHNHIRAPFATRKRMLRWGERPGSLDHHRS